MQEKGFIDPHGGYKKLKSYRTYKTYIEEGEPETGANTAICLIHQAHYLLDRQISQLERDFFEKGGFTEKLYHARKNVRGSR